MSSRNDYILTPALLLRAYAAGIFPMAESREATELRWFDPPVRAIIPLDESFHVPRRLKRTLRQRPYVIKFNTAFEAAMRACAAPRPARPPAPLPSSPLDGYDAAGRSFGATPTASEPVRAETGPDTWINEEIVRLYTTLHRQGHAHSIEAWKDGELVGGLYGVSLGSTFFGESMFSFRRDASKIALVYLVALLRHCGFTLLDTQFQTEHLARFGTIEITRANYHHLLAAALKNEAHVALPADDGWHHLALGV